MHLELKAFFAIRCSLKGILIQFIRFSTFFCTGAPSGECRIAKWNLRLINPLRLDSIKIEPYLRPLKCPKMFPNSSKLTNFRLDFLEILTTFSVQITCADTSGRPSKTLRWPISCRFLAVTPFHYSRKRSILVIAWGQFNTSITPSVKVSVPLRDHRGQHVMASCVDSRQQHWPMSAESATRTKCQTLQLIKFIRTFAAKQPTSVFLFHCSRFFFILGILVQTKNSKINYSTQHSLSQNIEQQ